MTLSRNYRAVLGIPGMARLVAATFLCTLLVGTANLALLLGAERATGSYAVGGAVAGACSIALALASPLWGRVVDRWGARSTLALATTAQSIAFTVYIGVAAAGGDMPSLVVSAFLAGACTPPTSAIAKRIFMTVSQEQGQHTLFAMSGLITETVFVIGALLVGVIVAVVDPLCAVVVTAAVSSIGAWWVRSAPAVRAMTRLVSAPPARRAKCEWTWPRAHVMLVVVFGAFAIGALQVSVVAHAGQAGTRPS
jgi:MFS family permease